jgi:hypothetical protein
MKKHNAHEIKDFQPMYVFLDVVNNVYPVVPPHLYPMYLYLQDTCGDILTVLQLHSYVIASRGILGTRWWCINHRENMYLNDLKLANLRSC